jgi:hypothetical protein
MIIAFKLGLAYGCGFPQFAARAAFDLQPQEPGKFASRPVTQPRPNEVKELMGERVLQLLGISEKSCFQYDASFANESCGMYGGSFLELARKQFSAMSG